MFPHLPSHPGLVVYLAGFLVNFSAASFSPSVCHQWLHRSSDFCPRSNPGLRVPKYGPAARILKLSAWPPEPLCLRSLRCSLLSPSRDGRAEKSQQASLAFQVQAPLPLGRDSGMGERHSAASQQEHFGEPKAGVRESSPFLTRVLVYQALEDTLLGWEGGKY